MARGHQILNSPWRWVMLVTLVVMSSVLGYMLLESDTTYSYTEQELEQHGTTTAHGRVVEPGFDCPGDLSGPVGAQLDCVMRSGPWLPDGSRAVPRGGGRALLTATVSETGEISWLDSDGAVLFRR